MRIINTYHQLRAAGGDRIAICYRRRGSITNSPAWQVLRITDGIERQTHAKGPWYNYGKKTFLLFGSCGTPQERKRLVLAQAASWVAATFGRRVFVRNRAGDMVEAEVQRAFPITDKRKAALRGEAPAIHSEDCTDRGADSR